jgi:hypothetical protein
MAKTKTVCIQLVGEQSPTAYDLNKKDLDNVMTAMVQAGIVSFEVSDGTVIINARHITYIGIDTGEFD